MRLCAVLKYTWRIFFIPDNLNRLLIVSMHVDNNSVGLGYSDSHFFKLISCPLSVQVYIISNTSLTIFDIIVYNLLLLSL